GRGSAGTNSFDGTSGATPFVGAAALMIRNWMATGGSTVDPGSVYSMLVLSGSGGTVDDAWGAGRLKLPTSGVVWWGSVRVDPSTVTTIDIPVDGLSVGSLEAAIWWPEYGTSWSGFPSPSERASIMLEAHD